MAVTYGLVFSLLDDLGDQVDRSEGKLKNAMRRVTTILRKEEGNKQFEICVFLF